MNALTAWMQRHSLISFLVLAYGLSWAIWIPMALAGVRVSEGQAWPTHIPGVFGPLAAAIIMTAVVAGTAGVWSLLRRMAKWKIAGKWYLAALSPLAFYAVGIVIQGALGRGWPDLAEMGQFSGLPVVIYPVMWLLLFALAYPEEIGWRGFAADDSLRTRSLLSTAVVVGLIWAVWHLPLFFVIENYRKNGLALFPVFTLGIICGSIVLTWLYQNSGGSLFIVAVWHGCYNLVSGTAAANGAPAAVVTTAVIVWAVLIVVAEVRGGRHEGGSDSSLVAEAQPLVRSSVRAYVTPQASATSSV